MFDEVRYRKPQIEDVELGYRLRQRGKRIMLDPTIQGTHLKAWTFGGIIRTDLTQRGIPWVRLLLEKAPGAGRAAWRKPAGVLLAISPGGLRPPLAKTVNG